MTERLNRNSNQENKIDIGSAKRLAPVFVVKGIRTFNLTEMEVALLKTAYKVEESPTYPLFREYFPLERNMIVFEFKMGKQKYFGQFGFDKKDRLVSTRIVEPFREATSILKNGNRVSLEWEFVRGINPPLMGFKASDGRALRHLHY